jgi:ribosomal protein S18 acetylase RimI-like enzyme
MIKEIEKTDISDCVEVIKESFMTVADEFGFTAENAPRFTAFAISEDRIRYQLENEQRLMIAYYDIGKIIGYYSLLIQDNGQCELNNLCVLPDHRHNGVGTTLLDDAFDRAKKRGCERINIGIVEENRILRKWYEKNGFVHTGTQKFDFFPFTCGYMEKRL